MGRPAVTRPDGLVAEWPAAVSHSRRVKRWWNGRRRRHSPGRTGDPSRWACGRTGTARSGVSPGWMGGGEEEATDAKGTLRDVRVRVKTWHTASVRGADACAAVRAGLPLLAARGVLHVEA